MAGLRDKFPENVPETYTMASTGKLERAPREESSHVYKRLGGGELIPKEDDLEMYNVASIEFGTWPREGGDESGHIYNRLYGGTGMTDDIIRERDIETYNVVTGKFEPDTENQHGKEFPGKK